MKCQVQKSRDVTEPGVVTSRMLSDWLSYPPYQWVSPVCGRTAVVSSPSSATVTVGPGLRKRSTCRPYGSATGDWPLVRLFHFDDGCAPWLLPRPPQNWSSAMSIVQLVSFGSPKFTALMSHRGEL